MTINIMAKKYKIFRFRVTFFKKLKKNYSGNEKNGNSNKKYKNSRVIFKIFFQ